MPKGPIPLVKIPETPSLTKVKNGEIVAKLTLNGNFIEYINYSMGNICTLIRIDTITSLYIDDNCPECLLVANGVNYHIDLPFKDVSSFLGQLDFK